MYGLLVDSFEPFFFHWYELPNGALKSTLPPRQKVVELLVSIVAVGNVFTVNAAALDVVVPHKFVTSMV